MADAIMSDVQISEVPQQSSTGIAMPAAPPLPQLAAVNEATTSTWPNSNGDSAACAVTPRTQHLQELEALGTDAVVIEQLKKDMYTPKKESTRQLDEWLHTPDPVDIVSTKGSQNSIPLASKPVTTSMPISYGPVDNTALSQIKRQKGTSIPYLQQTHSPTKER